MPEELMGPLAEDLEDIIDDAIGESLCSGCKAEDCYGNPSPCDSCETGKLIDSTSKLWAKEIALELEWRIARLAEERR